MRRPRLDLIVLGSTLSYMNILKLCLTGCQVGSGGALEDKRLGRNEHYTQTQTGRCKRVDSVDDPSLERRGSNIAS